MKRLYHTTLLVILALCSFALTMQAQKAYVGLEYQLSYNDNWGANRPVILTVYPNSPAAQTGLRSGDIIEAINGQETHTMPEEEMIRLLQSEGGASVDLLVSNFAYHRVERHLKPMAQPTGALTERDIARAFGMYSLEDESDILISYPISTGTEGKTDLINYETFGFVRTNKQHTNRDALIEQQITEALQALGLTYDQKNPDLLVDTYYSITENSAYDAAASRRSAVQTSLRIDPKAHKLVELPILPVGSDKTLARFYLKFGITIYSGVNEHKMLWTSEAEELLSDDYLLTDYTALTVPVMLLQFPFTRYFNSLVVRFATHRYLSLGINYQANNISTIHSLSPHSPAAEAGLRAGDEIVAINGRHIGTADELSKGYLAFVKKSMSCRTHERPFAIKDGPTNCRYWDAEDYARVAKLLDKDKYFGGFSYLFAFNPWITTAPRTGVVIDYLRDGVMQRVVVEPKLQESCYVTLE
ncbi:PDZ domain-containing protein [uncultured Porphyromonas sp.]|uniref:PDZ domain-containing protein n=1 Tax=uncultured Porphyromonas sp. TaxID=159274 RepID=UPI002584B966|nr:PDZ domain-containing protein [uncultured Porphyromonas sp.]